MITTLSTQGGRRYPQMGSTMSTWAGRLLSVGETVAVIAEVNMYIPIFRPRRR